MALEVGRITARIEAVTADFEQKISGAQKTFEGAQVKMEASARQATSTLQKAYVQRIVAANNAATKEIDAARRTMQERVRASSSTAEVNAVRKQYADRVAAVRAGAQQEIAAAQQSFLNASKGMRPAVEALDDVVKAAGRAGPSLNTVRSAMTALTASALQTAPGVAQVSSVLVQMGIGVGPTIAVLAGVGGLAWALAKVTSAARELKKEVEASDKAIAALGKTAASGFAELQAVQSARVTEIDEQIQQLRSISRARDLNPAEEKQYNDLLAERARRLSKIADLEGRITAFHKGELETRAKDQQEELDKELRAFEKHAEEVARLWQRMHQKLNWDPFGEGSRIRLTGASAVRPGPRAALSPEVFSAITAAAGAAARAVQGGGPGSPDIKPGKSIIDMLKKRLDPNMLLTNIAGGLLTGGVSTALGALTDLAGGLLGFGSKAKEAAEAMKQAREEWSKNIDRFILEHTGTDAQKSMADALDQVDAFISGFEEVSNKGKKLKRPDFQTLDEVLAWAQDLLASSFSVDPARAAEWQKIIESIRILQNELGKTAEAANDTVASLTNVPNGFKIALARFNATIGTPELPPFIPSGPRGGFNPVGSASTAPMRTATVINAQVIEVYGAKDVKAFLRELEIEAKRQELTGGTGFTMGY